MAVTADSGHPALEARARDLATRLGLPSVPPGAPTDEPLLLVVRPDRLELRVAGSGAGPVSCDFAAGAFGYRRTRPLRSELLARAVGFRGAPLEVVDMTAGLGRDAMLLALLGCRVTAVERDPIVHALLEDGLRRAQDDPDLAAALSDRLTLALGDAVAYLDGLEAPPDVVTLDPMFPPRAGTALSKKEMQALSLLLGAPEDSERLLDAALRSGARRVVLKRPLRAPALVAPGRPPPSTQLRGRSARFDVYVPPSRPGEA